MADNPRCKVFNIFVAATPTQGKIKNRRHLAFSSNTGQACECVYRQNFGSTIRKFDGGLQISCVDLSVDRNDVCCYPPCEFHPFQLAGR